MSFLRNIRNNLANHAYNTQRNGKSKQTNLSTNARTHNSGNESEQDRYGTYGGRRDSGSIATARKGSGSIVTTLRRDGKYSKENPAPIIVYVDKYETGPKPAGILRKNTFTKSDHDPERRKSGNAITRSDTFTINESEDEQKTNTNTYSKKKQKEKPQKNAVETDRGSTDNLPVVIDSRTYRKKSLKSSKPVQKVESFIKRFEKSLFKHESKKNGRKDSNSSVETYVPTFRDVGINCKLDEEEKLKARKKRQSSRDSLIEVSNVYHSSSSQKSFREGTGAPQNRPRERSSSPSKKFSTYDRKKQSQFDRDDTPARDCQRSTSPFETLELKAKPSEMSSHKARQKEAEMGYSTVSKKPASSLPRTQMQDRSKSILVTARKERFEPDSTKRNYTVTTSAHHHRVEFGQQGPFRSNTYDTLKEEYEQANRKPVGVASPRLSSSHTAQENTNTNRKDSTELPKYTFGTNLQERRSRFQQFQKSFKQLDDKSAEVTYQQSFFVPI
ncbi:serine/arginine repetitive matrix protein 5-like [Sabethes cyaneus]|uniref:serine/arginine repetitive matrix protein 5-like n=1 Tax=Sabethes cyaneus TaxID=53552 RepID=UPI00237D9E85|nr:serine/arginine repetitive matrix protein 5-like [Sabethes cyaneus]